MLPIDAKQLLLNLLPSNYNNLDIQRTIGRFNGEIQYPSINISFPVEGTTYFKPPGDFEYINNELMYGQEIQTAICRFQVFAIDTKQRTTEEITVIDGQTEYDVSKTPIVDVHNTSDYTVSSDHTGVEWQTSVPAGTETFTVDYSYIENGYWIASKIIDNLLQDISARFRQELSQYNVDILEMTSTDDISMMYVNENITALTFDIKFIYPFKWSRALTDEDGVPLDTVNTTVSRKS